MKKPYKQLFLYQSALAQEHLYVVLIGQSIALVFIFSVAYLLLHNKIRVILTLISVSRKSLCYLN